MFCHQVVEGEWTQSAQDLFGAQEQAFPWRKGALRIGFDNETWSGESDSWWSLEWKGEEVLLQWKCAEILLQLSLSLGGWWYLVDKLVSIFHSGLFELCGFCNTFNPQHDCAKVPTNIETEIGSVHDRWESLSIWRTVEEGVRQCCTGKMYWKSTKTSIDGKV